MPKEHGQKVFEFQKIEDAGAIMVHRPVLAPEEEVHVPLADLKKWRVTKTGMPQLASLEMIQRGLPQGNAICQEDLQRVQIAAALHAAHEQHALDPEDIAFSCQPQGLYTLKAVKKAALHLVPLGSIAKLKGPGETSKKLTIDHFGHKWTINAFKQDSMLQGTADAGCLTPFFWCKAATAPDSENMVWAHIKVNGIQIPILQNASALPAKTLLCYPKDEKEMGQAIAKGKSQGKTEASQAKKKARTA